MIFKLRDAFKNYSRSYTFKDGSQIDILNSQSGTKLPLLPFIPKTFDDLRAENWSMLVSFPSDLAGTPDTTLGF